MKFSAIRAETAKRVGCRVLTAAVLCIAALPAAAAVEYTYEGEDSKTYVASVTADDTLSAAALEVLDANAVTNFVKRGSANLSVTSGSVYTGDVRLENGRFHIYAENAFGVGPGRLHILQKKINMYSGSIAKDIVFDCGAGWSSDTGISMQAGEYRFKGKVTATDRSMNIYPYSGACLAFEGGFEQSGGNIYIREANGGTIVFRNSPMMTTSPYPLSFTGIGSPDASGFACHFVFAVAGNSLSKFGHPGDYRPHDVELRTTVDWAFDNASMSVCFANDCVWDLCGTSQRIGYLDVTHPSGDMSVVTNSSDKAASLYLNQTANATPAVLFGGNLSVDFSGNKTTTIDHAMTAKGAVTVNAGKLSFTENGSWRNATRLSVASGASVAAVNGTAFGPDVEIAISGSGSILLPAGVVQKAALLSLDGDYQPHGTYEAGSGEIEVAYSGRMEVVDGALVLAADESAMLDAYVMCDTFDKIVLGDGASLTIDDPSLLSSNTAYTITLGRDATLALPNGQGIVASSVTVGGTTLPAGRYESAGWLLGGAVFVPQGAIAGTDVAWIGEGVDTLMTTEGNWRGSADLANGTTRAVFADGGAAATVAGSVFLNGLSFNTSGGFTVDASAGARLRLASGGISTAGSGTYAISAPLVVDGDQTWNIGKAITMSGGLRSDPLARYAIRKTGAAYPTVKGTGDFSGEVLIEQGTFVISGDNPLGTSGEVKVSAGSSITFSGAASEKPLTVDTGVANWSSVTGFSVWGDNGASEQSGSVAVTGSGSFNVVMYSNNAQKGKMTFCGGIEGGAAYPHIYLYGGGESGTGYSTVVIKNRPFLFETGRYLSLHMLKANANGLSGVMDIQTPGNVCGHFGHPQYRAEKMNLYTRCNDAFAYADMTLYCGNNFTWDLCGTSQTIGQLQAVHTADNPPVVTNSSEAAASLTVNQSAAIDNVVLFAGNLNVAFAIGSGKTITIGNAMSATGSLTVSGGTLAFTADGAWSGATDVTVGTKGKITVANPRTFGRKANLVLASVASLEVASGVTVRAGSLSVGGMQYAPGPHQFGEGSVLVGTPGAMLIFR